MFGSRDAHRTQGCSSPPPPYRQDDNPEDPWHMRSRHTPPPSYGKDGPLGGHYHVQDEGILTDKEGLEGPARLYSVTP